MKLKVFTSIVIVYFLSMAATAYGQKATSEKIRRFSEKIQEVRNAYPALSNDQVEHLIITHFFTKLNREVTIAVLDSGVDVTHPAVKPYLEEGIDFSQSGKTHGTSGMIDSNGQGTHVAGIITQGLPAKSSFDDVIATITARYPDLSIDTIDGVLTILGRE